MWRLSASGSWFDPEYGEYFAFSTLLPSPGFSSPCVYTKCFGPVDVFLFSRRFGVQILRYDICDMASFNSFVLQKGGNHRRNVNNKAHESANLVFAFIHKRNGRGHAAAIDPQKEEKSKRAERKRVTFWTNDETQANGNINTANCTKKRKKARAVEGSTQRRKASGRKRKKRGVPCFRVSHLVGPEMIFDFFVYLLALGSGEVSRHFEQMPCHSLHTRIRHSRHDAMMMMTN